METELIGTYGLIMTMDCLIANGFVRFAFPILLAGWLAMLTPALAGGDALSSTEALNRARSGEVVIVDIRTIDEWVQTGVPQGAVEVSLLPQWGMPNPNFVEDVLAAMGGDRTAPPTILTLCR